MDNREESSYLTLEMVRELIAKEDNDVEILRIEEEVGSGRGDNYTSMLYRLHAIGRKLDKNGKSVDWHKAIIYKVLPQSRKRREMYKSEILFRNEMVFYNKVWPAFEELQHNKQKVFEGVAKVYIAKDDLIAMEDLKEKGYRMADRRKGLTVAEVEIVLKNLAGFHALSLTLRQKRPELFARLSEPVEGKGVHEALFRPEHEDYYRHYYRVATKNVLSMVSATLEEDRDLILGKLRDFLEEKTFFRTMCQISAEDGPLTVICHGDCWTNNFLFKEGPNNELTAVYFVDFQLTRVGSLALDLVYLFYSCTSGPMRKAHLTNFLRHYHRHLVSSLNILNPEGPPRDAEKLWDQLNSEMRRCGRFGFGTAVDLLPITTCASDQAPDVYEECAGENEEGNKRVPPEGGSECARLMTDLLIELVRNQAL